MMLQENVRIQSFLYPASSCSHWPKLQPAQCDLHRQAKPGQVIGAGSEESKDSIASLRMLMKGILKACNSFLFYRVFQKRISKGEHSRKVTLPFCYALFLKDTIIYWIEKTLVLSNLFL